VRVRCCVKRDRVEPNDHLLRLNLIFHDSQQRPSSVCHRRVNRLLYAERPGFAL
jgi:hypothetical protein